MAVGDVLKFPTSACKTSVPSNIDLLFRWTIMLDQLIYWKLFLKSGWFDKALYVSRRIVLDLLWIRNWNNRNYSQLYRNGFFLDYSVFLYRPYITRCFCLNRCLFFVKCCFSPYQRGLICAVVSWQVGLSAPPVVLSHWYFRRFFDIIGQRVLCFGGFELYFFVLRDLSVV